ncbi:MAG: hypothetical protein IKB93_05930 [Clostridia bacterium]|nr:hypothetical protein [Clostridia bacterium]
MKNDMIWSFYIRLGHNMWYTEHSEVVFDDEAWKKVVESAKKNGINMIVLDLGEGVQYATHPELAHPGAWTRERVRCEVKALKEMGITLIPKLNFSATHHLWLGEYRWMMSTKPYYDVCRDLIYEVNNLFDNPPYIHLGMDEEGDSQFANRMELVAYRRGELIWHDLQFLCDCVRDCGSTPWIWSDWHLYHPEEFKAHIKTDDIVLSPWYYYGFKEGRYTSIEYFKTFHEDLNHEPYLTLYKDMTYIEENAYSRLFIEKGKNAALDGYKVVPCCSNWARNPYNAEDLMEYFIENCPSDKVLGYMTAPWVGVEEVDKFTEAFEQLKNAREKHYG